MTAGRKIVTIGVMKETQISERVAVRLDAKLKKQAQKVLAKRGKTLSGELRAHLERLVKRDQKATLCQLKTEEEVVGELKITDNSSLQLKRTTGRIDC